MYQRSRVFSMHRTAFALVLVASGTFGLYGCAATPMAAAQSSDSPSDHSPVQLDGHIGTAVFQSSDQSVTGTVNLSSDGTYVFGELQDFRSAALPAATFVLSPWDSSSACPADENAPSSKPLSELTRPNKFTLARVADPGYFTSVIIAIPATESTSGQQSECARIPIAIAPIHWTFPSTRPYLHADDHGPRKGAEGTSKEEGSQPISYKVVAGDNYASIARRFGMTVDDVHYLNPLNTLPLWPGQSLNLSAKLRGAASAPAND